MKVACLQLNAKATLQDSITHALPLIEEAAQKNAKLIVTPENTSGIVYGEGSEERRKHIIHSEHGHPLLTAVMSLAQKYECAILLGSIIVTTRQNEKARNRSYLINESGAIEAFYDKIHLFDVQLETGEHHRESSLYEAGSCAVVAPAGDIVLGMTICYDLRFPALYQSLSAAGAHAICVPAAFTRPTGEAHWEILLRARAIENGCYILASAQCGTHDNGRQTWGHSMMIDPYGSVIASLDEEVGILYGEVDKQIRSHALKRLPILAHRKDFTAATI